ncbi:Bifunctional solanapyrone synthase [Colletotrichum siamense]|nr:Bifunctional solanapyrone synthase [Colletotrichum siamense]
MTLRSFPAKLAFVALLSTATAQDAGQTNSSACDTLQQTLGAITALPGSDSYTNATQDYFNAAAWLSPSCVIAPTTSQEMSNILGTFNDTNTQFAIRGGGHMTIANAANINAPGVLVATSGLSNLVLSDDQATIEVGAGNTWSDVYRFLEPYKLAVVGGRAGLVGVPGFLLGGGISFFSNEYGWASANVIQYDCVLGDGDIISATASNEYSDLFWALRGGGNSFAIVTGFHLKTLPLPEVAVGENQYSSNSSAQFLDSIYSFALDGSSDTHVGIEPRVQWIPSLYPDPSYYSILFNNGNTTTPPALINFTQTMEPISSSFTVRPSMYNWTQFADSSRSQLAGLRSAFHVVTIKANRQALDIVHDVFLDMMKTQISGVTNVIGSLAFVPVTEHFLSVSTANGGDPMDVDATQGTYILVEETVVWSEASDDAKIDQFLADFDTNVTSQINALGDVMSPFLYLNYAGAGQPVFQGYAGDNLQKMKDIRAKYDPDLIFTNLMPGGWKVEAA